MEHGIGEKMHESQLEEAVREIDTGNYGRARSLLQALGNEKEAQLQLAYLYQTGLGGDSEPAKTQEIYQSIADAGDVRGMYYLASLMLEKRQLKEALDYFEKSAQLGHISGSYWAAALHSGLYGHPKDEKKYLFFLGKAAQLGHVFAIRDQAVLDMHSAKNFLVWGKSFLRCLAAKIEGIFIAIRNPHDLRVR